MHACTRRISSSPSRTTPPACILCYTDLVPHACRRNFRWCVRAFQMRLPSFHGYVCIRYHLATPANPDSPWSWSTRPCNSCKSSKLLAFALLVNYPHMNGGRISSTGIRILPMCFWICTCAYIRLGRKEKLNRTAMMCGVPLRQYSA
jgi:hypothetical protein